MTEQQTTDRDRRIRRLYDRIRISQARWIVKKFGAPVAMAVNYGAFSAASDGDVNALLVQTRIVGRGTLSSIGSLDPERRISHTFKEDRKTK